MRYPHAVETNVLVIGMPNIGKSTLLNALRNMGIKGPTPKALRTSAHPGLTQALSTRLKLSLEPLVYAFDTPGVMLPFLGLGQEGAERGVKLALIAGIKEGLYDTEALAAYLLYRLNVLNPISPAYLQLLPPGSQPTTDLEEFMTILARRMGMVRRGASLDTARAASYFVKWWRDDGGLIAASSALQMDYHSRQTEGFNHSRVHGWGFDIEWQVQPGESEISGTERDLIMQNKMEQCIDDYLARVEKEEREENNVSQTQRKKQMALKEKNQKRLLYSKQ